MACLASNLPRALLVCLATVGAIMGCSVPAQATIAGSALPVLALAATQQHCESATSDTARTALSATIAKSAAILGERMSALDRIRLQQAGIAPVAASSARPLPEISRATCAVPLRPDPQNHFTPSVTRQSSRDFLATTRVAIGHTEFSRSWNRVSHSHLTRAEASWLTGGHTAHDLSTLAYVNRKVNHAIAYGSDSAVWHRKDYWATASQTLRRGKGDCEDVAIVKYQALIALGYDPKDLFLTLARDLLRNADHALLIVHENGRFYMLDNSTDAVLRADRSYDYRPTISFNSQSAWLHGYTVPAARTTLAYLSVKALLSPRVTGLNR